MNKAFLTKVLSGIVILVTLAACAPQSPAIEETPTTAPSATLVATKPAVATSTQAVVPTVATLPPGKYSTAHQPEIWDWADLEKYPEHPDQIGISDDLVVRALCVESKNAKVTFPTGDWQAWLAGENVFSECNPDTTYQVYALGTIENLPEFIFAVKVGRTRVNVPMFYSIHSTDLGFVEGNKLDFKVPDNSYYVACISTTFDDGFIYHSLLSMAPGTGYSVEFDRLDGWLQDLYPSDEENIRRSELSCLSDMAESVNPAGSSNFATYTDKFTGRWFGRPSAP